MKIHVGVTKLNGLPQSNLFGPAWPLGADELDEWLFDVAAGTELVDPIHIRELADSVWHFLNEDFANETPNIYDLHESAIKLVRELGQPVLAESLRASLANPADDGENSNWPRNLVAAQQLGILTISDFANPTQLAGGWIDVRPAFCFDDSDWQASLARAKQIYSRFVVFTDQQILFNSPSAETARKRLWQALETTGLSIVVNLNWPTKQSINADEPSLFPRWSQSDSTPTPAGPLDLAAIQHWQPQELERITWRWHLRASDMGNVARHRLRQVCDSAIAGGRWQFVIDRPHQLVTGSNGLTSDDPAILQCVIIRLDAFAQQVESRIASSQEFLDKLGSLARLVLEVGHARQRIIRRSGREEVRARFQPERSIMLVSIGDVAGALALLNKRFDVAGNDSELLVRQRLRDHLTNDQGGLIVRFTDDHGMVPVVDLRTAAGPELPFSERADVTDSLRVCVDSRHLLAAERLMHFIEQVSSQSNFREIQVDSGVPNTKSNS